jgi:hypothetical protein
MIIGKTFEKIQHPFLIKAMKKVGIECSCLYILKAMYDSQHDIE